MLLNLCLFLTICIVHNNTQLTLLCLIDLLKSYNVWVIQDFKNLGLAERLFLFLFTHLFDVDLLDDSETLLGIGT